MQNHSGKRLLLVSNSTQFKVLVKEYLDIPVSISICKTVIKAKRLLDNEIFQIVIIDHDIYSQKNNSYNLFLFSIFERNLSGSVIVFSSTISQKDIYMYYKYRINHLFFVSSINLFLEPTLKEILSLIPQTDDLVLKDRGISLYLKSNYAIFQGCKILLSNAEKLVLNYLLKKCSLCTKEELVIYLSNNLGRQISDAYLTVTVSRLRQKFIKQTRINLVKNRSGIGYYLSI